MTIELTLPHKFTPRPYQVELYAALDSGKRFGLCIWSRRAGKDKTAVNYVVKKAWEKVGVYYYFLPEYAQGRKAVWENIEDGEKLLDHIPDCLIKKKNNNEMKIELHNGSIIRIIGADNYDSIMGTNPIGCVFSEYSLQDPKAFDYILPILLQNNGWAILNGTPRGKNHLYKMLQVAKANPQLWFCSIIQSLWPDLPDYYPVVTPEQIEIARSAGQTEEHIMQEFGCCFDAAPSGTYYADVITKARQTGRIGLYPHNQALWVDTFWDIGKNDDTVIWFRQQQGGALIWVDYYENNNQDPAFYVQVLKEKGYNYKGLYLPHDAGHNTVTGCYKKLIQEAVMSAGIDVDVFVAPKPYHKIDAIRAVRSRFSRYFFNEATTRIALGKLSLYHRKYDPVRNVFLDTPVHDDNSHCADAITTEALTEDWNDGMLGGMFDQEVEIKTDFNPLDFED